MSTVSIPLSRGKFALIDEEDDELVSAYTWTANKSFSYKNVDVWYAQTSINGSNPRSMHRLIMGFPDAMVDHRNGDTLDNRRSNLRTCTNSQNQQNRTRLVLNTSGFRGVTWSKASQKWQAGIKLNGRSIHLGLFDRVEDAAVAYDIKAAELFGEFARLNFPIVAA